MTNEEFLETVRTRTGPLSVLRWFTGDSIPLSIINDVMRLAQAVTASDENVAIDWIVVPPFKCGQYDGKGYFGFWLDDKPKELLSPMPAPWPTQTPTVLPYQIHKPSFVQAPATSPPWEVTSSGSGHQSGIPGVSYPCVWNESKWP